MHISSILLVTSLSLTPPATGLSPAPSQSAQSPEPEIVWHYSALAAEAEAQRTNRPILFYFWLEGSTFCQQLYAETLTSEPGLNELANYVCVSVRADQEDARSLLQRFGITTLPTLLFTDPRGHAQDVLAGYIPLKGFLTESNRIRSNQDTVNFWRLRVLGSPKDLERRLRLALKLKSVGGVEESERLQQSIREDDPEGHTAAGAQLQLHVVFATVRNAASDPSDAGTYDLAPLYAHMPHVVPQSVRFEGWKWIADVEQQRGDRKRERRAWAESWSSAPDDTSRTNVGFSLLFRYFQMEVELDDNDRALAREAADHLVATAGEGPGQTKPSFAHQALAIALTLEGQPELALAEAQKAVDLEPGTASHVRLRDALRARTR